MSNIELNKMIKIARRYNNKKRSYLLVNTLQAKHIPTRPQDINFGTRIGQIIREEDFPNAHLVIGFAETATAIAADVAGEASLPSFAE
ncbi:MAG: phosphoribosyltransferase domain-containing protein [Ruminococcus sp.]|nr:phosphoribosyltransferase domain-containing protein [Ruminococcus sp.]